MDASRSASAGGSEGDSVQQSLLSAAHDLNGVWTVILGYAAQLSDGLDEARQSIGEERWVVLSRDLGEIRLAGEHGREITRRMRAALVHDEAPAS